MEYKIYLLCKCCNIYVDEALKKCNVCKSKLFCNNCSKHIEICRNCIKNKLEKIYSKQIKRKIK